MTDLEQAHSTLRASTNAATLDSGAGDLSRMREDDRSDCRLASDLRPTEKSDPASVGLRLGQIFASAEPDLEGGHSLPSSAQSSSPAYVPVFKSVYLSHRTGLYALQPQTSHHAPYKREAHDTAVPLSSPVLLNLVPRRATPVFRNSEKFAVLFSGHLLASVRHGNRPQVIGYRHYRTLRLGGPRRQVQLPRMEQFHTRVASAL